MFIAATTAAYYVAPYAAPYGVFYPPHGLGHFGLGHHGLHHGGGHDLAHLAGLLHHAVHHQERLAERRAIQAYRARVLRSTPRTPGAGLQWLLMQQNRGRALRKWGASAPGLGNSN